MTKISEFMIRVVLSNPIEVPDDKVADLCNALCQTIEWSSDLDWVIRDHIKQYTDDYPIDHILVWSHQEKYGND